MVNKYIIHGSNYIKKVTVAALRQIYAMQEEFPIYKYNDDTSATNILIYGYYPPTAMALPLLVVRSQSSTYHRAISDIQGGFDEKIDIVDGEAVTKKYAFGFIESTLYIDINTFTDEDRNALTDLTAFYIRYIFPDVLFKYGIGFNSASITGETEKDWSGKRIFANSVQMKVYTEVQYNRIDPLIYIEKLNLTLQSYI